MQKWHFLCILNGIYEKKNTLQLICIDINIHIGLIYTFEFSP